MNKIGILYGYWCTEWDQDYIPYLEKVKQLGFDTLEINTLRLTKMSDPEIEHFMERAKELQVDVLGVIGVPAHLDPAAPDASVRKSGIDYETNLIRICAKPAFPVPPAYSTADGSPAWKPTAVPPKPRAGSTAFPA